MKTYPLFFLFLVTAIGCTKKTDDGTAAHSATSSATVSHISVDHPIFAGVETCVYSNAAGAASYSWDFGDGQTSTLAKPCHTYSVAGAFTITLTVDGDPARRASANAVVSPAPGFSTEIAGMHTWRHMLTVIGDTVTGDTTYHYPDTSFAITYINPAKISALGIEIPCSYATDNYVYFSTEGKPRYEYLSFKRTGIADSLMFYKYRSWNATKVTVEYFYSP